MIHERTVPTVDTVRRRNQPRPRHVFLVVCAALAMAIVGCGPSGVEKRVIGTWTLAPGDNLAERMLGSENATENQPSSNAPIDDEVDSAGEPEAGRVGIAVHFLRDGQLATETSVMGEVTTKRGTWEIVSQEGDRVEIEFVLGSDEPQQISMLFESDDTVRMVPPNLAVLKRDYLFHKKQKD